MTCQTRHGLALLDVDGLTLGLLPVLAHLVLLVRAPLGGHLLALLGESQLLADSLGNLLTFPAENFPTVRHINLLTLLLRDLVADLFLYLCALFPRLRFGGALLHLFQLAARFG